MPGKPAEIAQWTNREMLELASRGLGKVVRDDIRGATLLSVDEIMAMSGVLIAMGLRATLPGDQPPAEIIIQMEGERA